MCIAPQRRALFRHLNVKKVVPSCFVHFDLEMCFAPQRRALFRHLNFQKCSEREVFLALFLTNVLCATRACTFSTAQLDKVVRTWRVCVFWLGNVLRARTFSISQLPKVVRRWWPVFDFQMCIAPQRRALFRHLNVKKVVPSCFVHFDLEMCFAPQRRALFRHLNFQKCSEREVFLALFLTNVLCATRACTFSTAQLDKVVRTWRVCVFWLGNVLRARTFSISQLPKVVRRWCALHILNWKCALHHMHFFDIWTSKSGLRMVCLVHFDLDMCFAPQRRAIFICHVASWLRTLCFGEPTSRSSGATNHWKNALNRTFSRTCIFFLLTLSLYDLLSSFFSSLTLPTSAFPSVHIVGSLTSKLPSIKKTPHVCT